MARSVGADLLRTLGDLLTYLYRRHLLTAFERLLLEADGADRGAPPGQRAAAPPGAVGFADLTEFTCTAATSSEAELTALVDDFGSLAADVVAAAGGRVVKLIGDDVGRVRSR